jgi:hypothetical protein
VGRRFALDQCRDHPGSERILLDIEPNRRQRLLVVSAVLAAAPGWIIFTLEAHKVDRPEDPLIERIAAALAEAHLAGFKLGQETAANYHDNTALKREQLAVKAEHQNNSNGARFWLERADRHKRDARKIRALPYPGVGALG